MIKNILNELNYKLKKVRNLNMSWWDNIVVVSQKLFIFAGITIVKPWDTCHFASW